MKKLLLIATLFIFAASKTHAQCVPTCSNYITYTVPYAPYPIAGNNAIPLFTPNTDDGLTSPIYIGFNFNFYCTTYSTVLIYTNGMIQFDIGQPSTFPLGYDPAQVFGGSSASGPPNALVAFRMDDLDPTQGGQITYTTLGTSPTQTFVVTYSNVPLFGNNSSLHSGQIALYETTNLIDIITISSPATSNAATQGIENQTGTLGVCPNPPLFGMPLLPNRNQAAINNNDWGTNNSWRFAPVGPSTLAPISGTVSSCQGLPQTYSISPVSGASSYNWSLPAGWSGSSTTSAISATTGVSGTLSLTATFTCGTSPATTISVTVIPSPTVSITSASPAIFCSGLTVTFQTSGASSYTLQPGNMTGTPPFFDTPLSNTSYTLTGTNSSGCISNNLSTSFITVKQTPTITVSSGAICLGATYVFTTTGGATYTNSAGPFGSVTPTLSGTPSYTVVGTGTNGCVSNSVVSTLTVYALPLVTALASRPDICTKESTSLTASGGQTYTWSTTSPTASNAVIVVNPITTTIYSVSSTDAKGCVGTQTVQVKVTSCNGVSENSALSKVLIYPNPARNEVHIQSEIPSSVNIYNMLGQKVLSATVTPGTTTLQLQGLRAGNYLVEISDGGQAVHKRLIIE